MTRPATDDAEGPPSPPRAKRRAAVRIAQGDRNPRPPRRPRPRPALPEPADYVAQAEGCLMAAAAAQDLAARALHEEECKLWLMLADQRRAIDAVVRRYRARPKDA